MLNKCDRLVNKVKSRCRNNGFKFGVKILPTVEYALRIFWGNGNTLRHDYIGKYIKKYKVAFNFIYRDDHALVGYKKIL